MSEMKIHRKTRVLLAAVVIVLAGVMLTGCDTEPDVSTTTGTVTKSECSAPYKDGADFKTCIITMPDTRRVTCITAAHGAMSCDWIHADGSDYMGKEE